MNLGSVVISHSPGEEPARTSSLLICSLLCISRCLLVLFILIWPHPSSLLCACPSSSTVAFPCSSFPVHLAAISARLSLALMPRHILQQHPHPSSSFTANLLLSSSFLLFSVSFSPSLLVLLLQLLHLLLSPSLFCEFMLLFVCMMLLL